MKILQYPHPALRQVAPPVMSITKDITLAAGRMLDLMYRHEGLGLAAPQVGLSARLLVMNFVGDAKRRDQEFVAVNPVIVESSGAFDGREGCLSFPQLFSKIRRAKNVRVQAYDLQGTLYEMVVSDLAARLWQHEIDHLDGKLFIDKMGLLGRRQSKSALQEFVDEFDAAKKAGSLPSDMEPIL